MSIPRQSICLADSSVHIAAVAASDHFWEVHTGTVQLFISGPGPNAWLAVSDSYYKGPIGSDDEHRIAKAAVAILNRAHRENKDAGPTEIRAALAQAKKSINHDDS